MNCMRNFDGLSDCPYCGAIAGQAVWKAPGLYPGTLLAGKYLLGRILGHGGFAVTYLAINLDLGIRVAIKEYFPSELAGRDQNTSRVFPHQTGNATPYADYFRRGLERFIEEGRNIVRCHEPSPHPNLVHVIDYFEDNCTAYLVMNYVDGVSLEKHLEKQASGRISVAEAIQIIMPVLDGLRAVHAKGFCHLDVKPGNIYLSHNGPVILLDFGTARTSLQQEARTQTVFLTPGFAPPEQYSSKGRRGPWSDIYGCAATLYQCVTGMEPVSSMDRIAGMELPRPSKVIGETIAPSVEKAILLGLENDVTLRPQSAKAYQDILENAIAGKYPSDVSSMKSNTDKGKKSPPHHSRRLLITKIILSGIVLCLMAGIVGLLVNYNIPDSSSETSPILLLPKGETNSTTPQRSITNPESSQPIISKPPDNLRGHVGESRKPVTDVGENKGGSATKVIPPQKLTLTSPNGGESWEPGRDYQITWVSSATSNQTVFLNYYHVNVWQGYIARLEPDDGIYTWTIPEDWPPRNDYKISVQLENSPVVIDFSDATFTIARKEPERQAEREKEDIEEYSPDIVQKHVSLTCGLDIEYPSRARINSEVDIKITAKNIFLHPYVGTVAFTLEGGRPFVSSRTGEYDIFSPEQRKTITVFRYEDTSLQRSTKDYDIVPKDTHVEIFDEIWEKNETKILAAPVVFKEKGTVSLKVRLSFTDRQDGKTIVVHNCPETLSTQSNTSYDEQGFPCYTLSIQVTD